MSGDSELEDLRVIKSLWQRKDDPTYATVWEQVAERHPDLMFAWLQVRLAKLAFEGLLQEKIDER